MGFTIQTDYSQIYLNKKYEGMLTSFDNSFRARLAGEALKPGRCLVTNTAGKVVLPRQSGGTQLNANTFAGFTILETAREIGPNMLFKENENINVCYRGELVVYCETACEVGQAVHVRTVAGVGAAELGTVRNAAVAGETATITGRFLEKLTAGGLVRIEFRTL
jgi:hypothetical protein